MSYTAEEKARGLDPKNVPTEPGAASHSDVLVGTGLDSGGEYVLVYPPEGEVAQTARALNDAAAGREQTVQWTGEAFRVPADVAESADLGGAATAPSPAADTAGGSSSPTVSESGSGNAAPGPDGNAPAVVPDADTAAAAAAAKKAAEDAAAGHQVPGADAGQQPAAPAPAKAAPAKAAPAKAAPAKAAPAKAAPKAAQAKAAQH